MSKRILNSITVFAAISVVLGVGSQPQIELKFADTILRSAVAIENDPVKSAQCFSTYLPKLNQITAAYEEQYQQCLKKSDSAKDSVQHEVEATAVMVNQTRDEICSGFSKCVFDSRPYNFFECSNAAAGDAITKAYNIQTISKGRMEYITLRYETINYDQNVCTAKCSQKYVEDSAMVHAELQDCLAGKTEMASNVVTTPANETMATTPVNKTK